MAETAQQHATYADLEAVPANLVAEILFGTLVTHPRPMLRHGVAASVLGMELGSPFQRRRGGPGGWVFIDEPQLHFGPHVTVPDIAAWRLERMPRIPTTVGITTPPDWLCEVLSPSTAKYDRGDKFRIYATYGVKHAWLVDPVLRTLEAYELRDGKWLLLDVKKDNDDIALPPFDAVTWPLDALWPFDEADPAAT